MKHYFPSDIHQVNVAQTGHTHGYRQETRKGELVNKLLDRQSNVEVSPTGVPILSVNCSACEPHLKHLGGVPSPSHVKPTYDERLAQETASRSETVAIRELARAMLAGASQTVIPPSQPIPVTVGP